MSVYVLLEAFTKLEMRLNDGLEGTVALRGPHPIQELRTRVDKFIRMLASMDILVSKIYFLYTIFFNISNLNCVCFFQM